MPWSHQTFRLVSTVKLLGIMLRNTCWSTTFHIVTARDVDGCCHKWLVWSTPQTQPDRSSVSNIRFSLFIGHHVLESQVWDLPMLERYMVSIININNGIQEPTWGHQNYNTNQILIFGRNLKVRKSLYTRVIIHVSTILNHIDIKVNLPRYESSCMVYRPEWYWKKTYPYPSKSMRSSL